jgi:hypothetical protein
MIAPLQTDRLLLQPLRLADAEQTQRLFPRWEMVKFMTTQIPWPYPVDRAFTYYRDVALPAMERGGGVALDLEVAAIAGGAHRRSGWLPRMAMLLADSGWGYPGRGRG